MTRFDAMTVLLTHIRDDMERSTYGDPELSFFLGAKNESGYALAWVLHDLLHFGFIGFDGRLEVFDIAGGRLDNAETILRDLARRLAKGKGTLEGVSAGDKDAWLGFWDRVTARVL